MPIPRPIITREHGAWALLVVPLAAGAICGGFVWQQALLALSALGFFMSYVPAHTLLRAARGRSLPAEKKHAAVFWTWSYGLVGVAAVIPLLIGGSWLLVPMGGAAMALFAANYALTIRRPKTIPGDLVAMLGLTLGAPAAYYIARGTWDIGASAAWIASALFFGASVFYVHMRIHAAMTKRTRTMRERLQLGAGCLMYHLFLWIVVWYVVTFYRLPSGAFVLLAPMSIHAVYGILTLTATTNFKRLGIVLVAHSLVFLTLLAIVCHAID